MKTKAFALINIFLLCFCIGLNISACGKASLDLDRNLQTTSPSTIPSKTSDNSSTASSQGTLDSTPIILKPSADAVETFTCDVAIIDVSNKSEGYIMVKYSGNNPKVKLQLTGADGITYTYNLHNDYEVFPLTSGSGNYNASIFENIQDTQYATILSQDFSVEIVNVFGPYLYPNQYVNFSESSKPIAKAKELAEAANTDIEVIENVYNYIIENFTYDYDKASSVESGYLPDVDEIFSTNCGICFDYAAVMATMLRTQNIPTRLEVGYMGEAYHAWISTYIKDVGWVNGIIAFNGKSWNLMDPTFASTSNSPTNFISENGKYITKYVY